MPTNKMISPSGLELYAPKGEFRVIGVDTFEGPCADYLIGDYDTREEAIRVGDEHGGEMNIIYVYDSKGNQLHKAGTF
jgi:hypothetical protein